MEITSIHAATAQPEAVAPPPPDELREACRQFEAIFIRQIMEQSMAPLLAKPEESLGGGGDVHRYMVADVLAQQLSESGAFGIADMLQAQFQFPNDSTHQTISQTKP